MTGAALKDFRFVNQDGTRCSYLETLKAACDQYGQYCGRWHDNDYWRDLGERAKTMSEEEAEQAVRQYEREAEAELSRWRMYQ